MMVTARTHTRLVRAGDVLTTAGQWTIAVAVILAACALASVLSAVGFLSVLEMVAGWSR